MLWYSSPAPKYERRVWCKSWLQTRIDATWAGLRFLQCPYLVFIWNSLTQIAIYQKFRLMCSVMLRNKRILQNTSMYAILPSRILIHIQPVMSLADEVTSKQLSSSMLVFECAPTAIIRVPLKVLTNLYQAQPHRVASSRNLICICNRFGSTSQLNSYLDCPWIRGGGFPGGYGQHTYTRD